MIDSELRPGRHGPRRRGASTPRGVSRSAVGRRQQGRPFLRMELDILDPRAGLGEAIVEMADIAHPIAERAAIRIELPGPDNNLLGGMAGETRAEQQDRPVLRRAL